MFSRIDMGPQVAYDTFLFFKENTDGTVKSFELFTAPSEMRLFASASILNHRKNKFLQGYHQLWDTSDCPAGFLCHYVCLYGWFRMRFALTMLRSDIIGRRSLSLFCRQQNRLPCRRAA